MVELKRSRFLQEVASWSFRYDAGEGGQSTVSPSATPSVARAARLQETPKNEIEAIQGVVSEPLGNLRWPLMITGRALI